MRQNSSKLGFFIALIVMAVVGIGAYLFLTKGSAGNGGTDPNVGQATEIPPPPVRILEASSDIPANTLITSADREQYFTVNQVPPSEVNTDDVREDEFSTLVANNVTIAPIRGNERIKKSMFRPAGVAEKIPTAVAGSETTKAMNVFVTDLGNIAAEGNSVDIIASYTIDQPYLRFTGVTGGIVQLQDAIYTDISTKVIAQNVKVLQVFPPPVVVPEGEQGGAQQAAPVATTEAGVAAPTVEPVFNAGSQWQLVLAVTDQQAELISYSINKTGSVLNLIVRRADDAEQVTTTGATMDLLMRLYGVPQIYAQPNMIVKLLDAPPPPQPPNQPAVIIPFPLPFGPQTVPLPTAVPTPTTTP